MARVLLDRDVTAVGADAFLDDLERALGVARVGHVGRDLEADLAAVRIELQVLVEVLAALILETQLGAQDGEVQDRVLVERADLEHLLEGRDRVLLATQLLQRAALAVPGRLGLRVDGDRLLAVLERVLPLGAGEVVVAVDRELELLHVGLELRHDLVGGLLRIGRLEGRDVEGAVGRRADDLRGHGRAARALLVLAAHDQLDPGQAGELHALHAVREVLFLDAVLLEGILEVLHVDGLVREHLLDAFLHFIGDLLTEVALAAGLVEHCRDEDLHTVAALLLRLSGVRQDGARNEEERQRDRDSPGKGCPMHCPESPLPRVHKRPPAPGDRLARCNTSNDKTFGLCGFIPTGTRDGGRTA